MTSTSTYCEKKREASKRGGGERMHDTATHPNDGKQEKPQRYLC